MGSIVPSKAESLRGVSCRAGGGVTAGVEFIVSLDTDDLDFFCGTA